MIKFEIGGRKVDPENIADALEAEMLKAVRAELQDKIGSIRDPETNEFPTIVVRGDDLENLTIKVEGSERLVALVRENLAMNKEQIDEVSPNTETPRAFLCFASEDKKLAEDIATTLQGKGIDTWWAGWSISTGDSFRQKIDEGISECTHFLVLLTPTSVDKPWVNLEMDAGLIRTLERLCRFLPVRYNLPISSLPPTLSGLHAPEVTTDNDIDQLVQDIYGVSRKPKLGKPPAAVERTAGSDTGYSVAATSVARYFVENSENALFADPQIKLNDLAEEVGLSVEDTKDAVYELSGLIRDTVYTLAPEGALFSEFDRYWMGWNPAEDALRLSADIVSDPDFPSGSGEIAQRYGWEPRRLNPVIHFLKDRNLIRDYSTIGSASWAMVRIIGNDHMRRFVKSRT